jgi:hypothetical protein
MERHIIPAENLKQFVFGGAAVFTVESNANRSDYYTFKLRHFDKVETVEGKRKKTLDRNSSIRVWVLSGSNNMSDYQYLGTINTRSLVFKPKNEVSEAKSVQLISALVRLISLGGAPRNATIYHEGKCGVCGRRLTTPDSITSGIGPTCRSMGKKTGLI